jgi:tRNA pseudouridine38-40 synthase
MQKNPGAKTIEGDLEEALFHAGAVPEQDRGIPKRYDWARSARTDKGVSAVGQVVSGRFYIDPPGLVERLHSNLSPQFRIFGYKRVTGSFNAKKFCDRRRYVYLIPVFALDPCSHRDRESVLASLRSGSELIKCLECSERGRKVAGAVGKRSFELTDNSSNDKDASVKSEIKEEVGVLLDNGLEDIRNSETVNETKIFQNDGSGSKSVMPESVISSNSEDANVNPESKDEIIVSVENGDDEKTKSKEEMVKGSSFCYGEKEKERFNRILGYYVGSHNFHNFTTRTKAEDPSARRYIVSFEAKTTVNVEGIEFVKCEVVGQSFMLHQIRKMIGVAVAIMRNCAPESLIQTALQK